MKRAFFLIFLSLLIPSIGSAQSEVRIGEVTSFKKRFSQINALTVIYLNEEQLTCSTISLKAHVQPGIPGLEAKVLYFRHTSPHMDESLKQAGLAAHTLYPEWEKGLDIIIEYDDTHTIAEPDALETPLAVLLLSTLSPLKLDSGIALTGALSKEWEILPITGTEGEILSASRSGVKFLGIPQKNASDFRDMIILDSKNALWDMQVFGVETLYEAINLARTDKSENLKIAISLFEDIQQKLHIGLIQPQSNDPAVIAQLEKILQLAPNHLSAKCLLEVIQNRLPETASLKASLDQLLAIAAPFFEYLDKAATKQESPLYVSLNREFYNRALEKLDRMKNVLDPEALPLHQRLTEMIQNWQLLDQITKGEKIVNWEEKIQKIDQLDQSIYQIRIMINELIHQGKLRSDLLDSTHPL